MAAYSTVSWQPGDEVTSQKLAQMASNEQWLKDNIIPGSIHFILNGQSKPPGGRKAEVISATKLEVINVAYDSVSARRYYDFKIKMPPTFTVPPVVLYSISTPLIDESVRMAFQNGVKDMTFRAWDVNLKSLRHQGEITIWMLGK